MAAGPAVRMGGVGCRRFDRRDGRTRTVIEQIDWRVERGEQWAVMGPNGAGKSTLVTIAAAAAFPTAGTAQVLGQTLGSTDMRLLRRRIGLVEPRTTRQIEPGLSAHQVVLTGATATLFPLPDRLTAGDERRAGELLERFGCAAVAGRRFGDCSDGERRRVLLARALIRRPELVILDEPAAGLDLPGREALVQALAELARGDRRVTTVLVTHHPEELPATTTHALLLRGGRTSGQGPVEQVITADRLSECFGVAVAVERHDGRFTARARGSFLSRPAH